MFGVFEFLITIILLFLLVVYIIYRDIKADITQKIKDAKKKDDDSKTDETSSTSSTTTTATATAKTTEDKKYPTKCKNKCTKPTEISGTCYHPVQYNSTLKKNQEIKSELICPWQCSSTYSDDPNICQYEEDCSECSPTASFPVTDSKCPNSTYGCCGDGVTEKMDKFGNNCLGLTGATGAKGITGCKGTTGCTEAFGNIQVDESNDKHDTLILTEYDGSKNMYPTCPNIHSPNENAFQKDQKPKQETQLGTVLWSVVTDYTTFGV